MILPMLNFEGKYMAANIALINGQSGLCLRPPSMPNLLFTVFGRPGSFLQPVEVGGIGFLAGVGQFCRQTSMIRRYPRRVTKCKKRDH